LRYRLSHEDERWRAGIVLRCNGRQDEPDTRLDLYGTAPGLPGPEALAGWTGLLTAADADADFPHLGHLRQGNGHAFVEDATLVCGRWHGETLEVRLRARADLARGFRPLTGSVRLQVEARARFEGLVVADTSYALAEARLAQCFDRSLFGEPRPDAHGELLFPPKARP